MLSASRGRWDLAGLLHILSSHCCLISLKHAAWRGSMPRLVCLPLAVTVLFGPQCKYHGSEIPQLSMLCHFFKGNWLVFHQRGAKEHWQPTLVWHIWKGRKRAESKCCFILCIHMEIFHLHQRIRRKKTLKFNTRASSLHRTFQIFDLIL